MNGRAPAAGIPEHERLATFGSAVCAVLTEMRPLPQTLGACAASMVAHLGAALARIWTLDLDGTTLRLQASAGLYTHLDGPHGRVRVGELKVGHIAASRRPHLTNALADDPEVSDPAWVRRERLVAFAGYPLVIDDRLVGVMGMFAREPLSDATLSALSMVARQVALVVDRQVIGEALVEVESRTAAALEAGGLGVWENNLDAGRVYWSPSLRALLGVGPEREASRPGFLELVHPDDRDTMARRMGHAVATGEALATECRIVRPDGRTIWVACRGRLAEIGGARRFIGVAADISDRKNLEQQFYQAQKMEAVGRLAGGIAHDFNNLLTIILGCISLMKDDIAPATQTFSDLEEIERAAERARTLTAQLLAFGRRQLLQPREIDLRQTTAATIAMLEQVVGADVPIAARLDAPAGMVVADPAQVGQVLVNLAANAREAMPEGGTLTIEVRDVRLEQGQCDGVPPGSYVALEVSDTGRGMDAATQARLFEPFFTTKPNGSGLGLAMVYGAVRQSGGFVAVESAPGRGSTFRIYLPRVHATQPAAAERGPRGAPAAEAGGGSRILLVEDTAGVRNLARKLLERAGYSVLEASNAAEARGVADAPGGIDLLLTDVVMPGASGAALHAELAGRFPGLRAIYMSGYTEDTVARQGISTGAVPFLQKPFTRETLLGKVREVLDA